MTYIPYTLPWEDAYYEAIMKCVERYNEMIQDEPAMGDVSEFLDEFGKSVPILKLSRWLGYVQGVMIERGFSTVQEERDWTRPLFRPLDTPWDWVEEDA